MTCSCRSSAPITLFSRHQERAKYFGNSKEPAFFGWFTTTSLRSSATGGRIRPCESCLPGPETAACTRARASRVMRTAATATRSSALPTRAPSPARPLPRARATRQAALMRGPATACLLLHAAPGPPPANERCLATFLDAPQRPLRPSPALHSYTYLPKLSWSLSPLAETPHSNNKNRNG